MWPRLEERAEQRYIPPTALALIHVGLGEMDEAVEARDRLLVFLRESPKFDELQPDPRFDDLLSRIGLPSQPTPPGQEP